MPDITMCDGIGCAKKDECYRYTAEPDRLQSYFAAIPCEEDEQCDYFIDNHEK